jgi:sphingosine kinase
VITMSQYQFPASQARGSLGVWKSLLENDAFSLKDTLALFQALVRIMNLRKYYGSIQYVPAPGYEAYGDVVKQVENCTVECQEQIGKSLCSYQGPSVEFQGSEWRSLDGPFVSIWINNVQWAAESIMAAPGAKVIEFFALLWRGCFSYRLLGLWSCVFFLLYQ